MHARWPHRKGTEAVCLSLAPFCFMRALQLPVALPIQVRVLPDLRSLILAVTPTTLSYLGIYFTLQAGFTNLGRHVDKRLALWVLETNLEATRPYPRLWEDSRTGAMSLSNASASRLPGPGKPLTYAFSIFHT